ncbi:hypothetical protein STENM36S_07578 [Streptomyces tendae]
MRHMPFFRWVLTLGFVLFACAVGLYAAAPDLPEARQIDLTVLDEEPDGSCTVRWSDPYQKREREASYQCDPGRSDLLKASQSSGSGGYGWESGFMFTEGPDRGNLEDRRRRAGARRPVRRHGMRFSCSLGTLRGLIALVNRAELRVHVQETFRSSASPTRTGSLTMVAFRASRLVRRATDRRPRPRRVASHFQEVRCPGADQKRTERALERRREDS